MLKRYKGASRYKDEFLRFYEALTTNKKYIENGVPLSFFEIIPIDKRIEE